VRPQKRSKTDPALEAEIARRERAEEALREIHAQLDALVEERIADLQKAKEQLQREVAERRRVEEALRESEERFRTVFEFAALGIAIDVEGRLIQTNRALQEMLGYTAEEFRGMLFTDFTHPDDVEASMRLARGLHEGKYDNYWVEKRYYRKDGRVVWARTTVSAVRDAGGKILYVIPLIEDITERKRLEEQLRQSQKMEAVGQLAGGVAHDFNNQLGIIKGYVDLVLRATPEDSPVRHNLLQVRETVLRSARLIRQLLLFGRKQPMEMRPTDLNYQVRELQKMLRRLLGEDIEVELDLTEGLWTVNADPGNLDQVIINLSVNARDAMPGGGALRFRTRNEVIDEAHCRQRPEARAGRFVCLAVCDTGVGMDEEVKARLFEPFFTTKGPGRGTGLGLAVVYGIVQAHEGWIAVESRVGQGSRFEVYLPVLELGTEAEDTAERPLLPDRYRGQGERVLLVEDEPMLRAVTEQALVENGYAVRACGTVAEAMEAFRREGGDLILSDVVLPDGRGTDLVFQALRERPGLAALLVTGYTDERADWDRVREAGLTLLQKPFETADLLEQIYRALQRRKESQGST
jgi:PAS domain S-box-containing protein